MFPYMFCQMLSCICAYIDTHLKKRNSIGVFGWISIVSPCILAGARDVSVGADTSGYGLLVFQIAKQTNGVIEFMSLDNAYVRGVEWLYRLFVYIISHLSDDIFWQFFLIQFIITYFLYISLIRSEVRKYTWLGLLVYYNLFFSFSLNIMRQSIAMFIILWGVKFIQKRELWKYLGTVILCVLIHKISIIAFFLYPLYQICTMEKSKRKGIFLNACIKYKKVIFAIIILLAITIVVNGRKIITLLAVFKASYSGQLGLFKDSFDFNVAALVFMAMILLPIIFKWKRLVAIDKTFNFYIVCTITALILWQLSGILQEAYRVCLYVWIFIIPAISKMIMLLNRKKRILMITYYIIVLQIYYYYHFVIVLANKTYPYTSEILGIK